MKGARSAAAAIVLVACAGPSAPPATSTGGRDLASARTVAIAAPPDASRAAPGSASSAVRGDDAPSPEVPTDRPVTCSLPPRTPPSLVLELTRVTRPKGEVGTDELVQVTGTGRCDTDVLCARIAPDRIFELFDRAAAMTRLQHTGRATSPHHTSRTIRILWDEGACAIRDGSEDPLVDRDRAAFLDLFDAIARAIEGTSLLAAP